LPRFSDIFKKIIYFYIIICYNLLLQRTGVDTKLKKVAKAPKNCRLGTVGGQAVLEGVMMKSGKKFSVAVRKEDGSIVVTNRVFTSIKEKFKFFRLPVIRGVVNFIEMMKLSFTTLAISAEAIDLEEEEPSKFEKWLEKRFGKTIFDVVMAISMVLGFALGLGLFMFVPILIARGVEALAGTDIGWGKNLIEGLSKIVIFIVYLWAVAFMKDIRRTFEYHGAEHKSIYCYEAGEELTPENVRKHTRFHPRCGTSFMFVMLLLSILIFSLPIVPWDNMLLRLVIKLALLPLVVGLGYEFIMYAGKHDNALIKALSAPGLFMQRLTTREPDDSQIEVAIKALKASMPDVFPEEAALWEETESEKSKKDAE